MRSFSFRNSKGSYRGIPIIAANMDTVGTFEMALALHQVDCAWRRTLLNPHFHVFTEHTGLSVHLFLPEMVENSIIPIQHSVLTNKDLRLTQRGHKT